MTLVSFKCQSTVHVVMLFNIRSAHSARKHILYTSLPCQEVRRPTRLRTSSKKSDQPAYEWTTSRCFGQQPSVVCVLQCLKIFWPLLDLELSHFALLDIPQLLRGTLHHLTFTTVSFLTLPNVNSRHIPTDTF